MNNKLADALALIFILGLFLLFAMAGYAEGFREGKKFQFNEDASNVHEFCRRLHGK